MAAGAVTTVEEALAAAGDGKATTLVCPVLEQRVSRLGPGERRGRRLESRSAVLFVTAGEGRLRIGEQDHALAPETAVFVADGDEVEAENTGAGDLDIVAVLAPPAERTGPRVVRYSEQEAEPAGIGREFRLLADCSQATQFIGVIPPGRAKMHNHPYDELAYVVEGDGVLHWEDGTSVPVGAGSCIYFPRLVFHSLENVGERPIRIMGVFHPAGSPADRVAELDY